MDQIQEAGRSSGDEDEKNDSGGSESERSVIEPSTAPRQQEPISMADAMADGNFLDVLHLALQQKAKSLKDRDKIKKAREAELRLLNRKGENFNFKQDIATTIFKKVKKDEHRKAASSTKMLYKLTRKKTKRIKMEHTNETDESVDENEPTIPR